MISFFLGVLASIFLILAKFGLAKVILYKKSQFLWAGIIIFSEIMVISLAYLTIGILDYTGEKFIYGFSLGVVTLVLFYVISHTLKNVEEED